MAANGKGGLTTKVAMRAAMTADDPFDLARFLQAQERTYAAALGELRAGRKRGHWMWFVFPQLRGLGSSPTSQLYGIGSLAEARAYLRHPILGTRLAECTVAVLAADRSLRDLLGAPDDLKFRSSMTLFSMADPASPLFARALRQFSGGEPDAATLALMADGRDGGDAAGE
jgi:uncharacterized protein (DUF1810 family)